MAKKGLVVKHKKFEKNGFKFSAREYHRCGICGNPRGYMRRFKVCRKCFRELAHKGEIPGIRKASW